MNFDKVEGFIGYMENSFIAIRKPTLNVDQYGCKCELPRNFWWKFPKLNFNNICATLCEMHKEVHLWLYAN
jgi:hypothetical protein